MTRIATVAVRRPTPKAGVGGFTLIEIMIVVLIIGVLMAIAYPSYQDNVIRSRRATAAGCLLELAQIMERSYTTNLTYPAVVPASQCRTDLAIFYTFSFDTAPVGKAYKLQVVPQGRQLRDTKCATMKMDEAGRKEKTGTASSVSECF